MSTSSHHFGEASGLAVTAPPEGYDRGRDMMHLIEVLYPLHRSITGNGTRKTLQTLKQYIPLSIHEVESGTSVFDWTVPDEWNLRDAYIKNAAGRRVVDVRASNLHVVSYSVPIHSWLTRDELEPRLHTLPDHPTWIPYRTSYYERNWGFCLTHQQYQDLGSGPFEVCIDATLEPGSLTYGEWVVPGKSEEEILFSCHICHPSLCNDNLSGIALTTFLAESIANRSDRQYTYRFLFIPGTIGAITWLALHETQTRQIAHGLVVSNVGDPGAMTYKRSRRGDATIDRVVEHVLEQRQSDADVRDFIPYGYDERQYCSPGFNLPVGNLTRTPYGEYPEYHTSADNLDFVRPEALADSFDVYSRVVEVLEQNETYTSLNPKCEPQLGRRGLYDAVGGRSDAKDRQMTMLWVLNLSDGDHSLLDIARRADRPFREVREVADALIEHDLLAEETRRPPPARNRSNDPSRNVL